MRSQKVMCAWTGYKNFFIWPYVNNLLFQALIVTLILYCIDRQSPNGCRQLANRDDSEMTGQEFALSNCLWFATASILQQGPDYTPKSPAARILSASFWFFTLIIISTYTANLAAFFTSKDFHFKDVTPKGYTKIPLDFS